MILGAVGSGDLHRAPQAKEEHAPRPLRLIGRSGVYALYTLGESMTPVFRSGDIVYVDAESEPGPGDYLVFESTRFVGDRTSRRYIKRLGGPTEAHILVKQMNPPTDERFPRSAVKWIHRVIPKSELA
jgi:phage repressor protein C with HTH and peptisase S24 domain